MKSHWIRWVAGAVAGIALIVAALAGFRVATQTRTVAVSAGDVRVFEDELPADAQGEITQLKHQEYQIKVRAFQNLMVRRLIEAEAKRRNISFEQLLEAEGRARIAQPTDAELETYFEQKKASYEKPLGEIKAKVRADLTEERLRDGQRQFVQEMWRAAKVEVLLSPPRFPVEPDRQRWRGNPSAPVVIVEFSDFQCPFCRRVQPTLNALLEKYPGQVALSFRDYPILELHPMAGLSAQAARCAGAQGKFWEYHNLLFAEMKQPDRALLGKLGAQLQLDEKAFGECLDSGAQKQAVESDVQAGMRIGVSSTPAFFINGIYVSGALPLEEFQRIIDRELRGAQGKP